MCDTLPGVALEDTGGAGTAGSHWEMRVSSSILLSVPDILFVQSNHIFIYIYISETNDAYLIRLLETNIWQDLLTH